MTLSRIFESQSLWNYALMLLTLHLEHVTDMGEIVCHCVTNVVLHSPLLAAVALNIVDRMSELQILVISPEVRFALITGSDANNT